MLFVYIKLKFKFILLYPLSAVFFFFFFNHWSEWLCCADPDSAVLTVVQNQAAVWSHETFEKVKHKSRRTVCTNRWCTVSLIYHFVYILFDLLWAEMFSDEESLAFGVDKSKMHQQYWERMLLKGECRV